MIIPSCAFCQCIYKATEAKHSGTQFLRFFLFSSHPYLHSCLSSSRSCFSRSWQLASCHLCFWIKRERVREHITFKDPKYSNTQITDKIKISAFPFGFAPQSRNHFSVGWLCWVQLNITEVPIIFFSLSFWYYIEMLFCSVLFCFCFCFSHCLCLFM